MSEEIVKDSIEEKAEIVEKPVEPVVAKPARMHKGGFMNGGFAMTVLFLFAFFLASFSLGIMTERNTKLVSALGSGGNLAAQPGAAGAAAGTAQQTGLQDNAKVTQKIEIDEGRVKGNKNAKVTIYEYSDFECPYCGQFYTTTYKELMTKYVDTGKVKIAFKDFPLSFHPQAQKAAEASRCALEQGKFWEMHDKLFENQTTLSVENFKKWAGELKLDTNKFNQCLDSSKYADAVKKDLAEGLKLGVQGTPSFVIGDTALVGAQPMAAFEKIIEEKLK